MKEVITNSNNLGSDLLVSKLRKNIPNMNLKKFKWQNFKILNHLMILQVLVSMIDLLEYEVEWWLNKT
jgi:hypothetical protein